MHKKTLSREELYNLVWKRPMTELAVELGISDVGLAKLCRRNCIPLPPQGFHLRKPCIKKDKLVIPLPPIDSGQQSSFRFTTNRMNNTHRIKKVDEKLDKMSGKNRIDIIPMHSREIKSILKTIKQKISLRKVDERGILMVPSQNFPIRVAPASYKRAEDLITMLFKELLSVGAIINAYNSNNDKEWLTTRWEGYEFKIQLEEFSTRQEIPLEKRHKTKYPCSSDAWRLVPTNKLTLKVNGPGYGNITVRDGRSLIEERLDEVIKKMLSQTIVERENERIRDERKIKAVAYLKEKDKYDREAEFQVLCKKKFIQESRCWQRAETMRAYIDATEITDIHNLKVFAADVEKQQWLEWARDYTKTICPVASGLVGKLPPYPEGKKITRVPSFMLEYDEPEEAVLNNDQFWYYVDI